MVDYTEPSVYAHMLNFQYHTTYRIFVHIATVSPCNMDNS